MLEMLVFYDGDGPSKVQEEFVKNIEILFDGKVEVKRFEVSENKETAKINGVREVPTIVIKKDGETVEKFAGLTQELFLKRALEKNIV